MDLAKQNVLSLSKEIVPQMVDQSINELYLLRAIPNEPAPSKKLEVQSGNAISMECASN